MKARCLDEFQDVCAGGLKWLSLEKRHQIKRLMKKCTCNCPKACFPETFPEIFLI